MIIAQVLLVFLVVLAVGGVIAKYREGRIGVAAFLFWMLLWSAAVLVILFPDSTIIVARSLGIGRGVDLVLYLSVILILYLIFRLYVRIEQMERDLTQVVRSIAIREENAPPPGRGEGTPPAAGKGP